MAGIDDRYFYDLANGRTTAMNRYNGEELKEQPEGSLNLHISVTNGDHKGTDWISYTFFDAEHEGSAELLSIELILKQFLQGNMIASEVEKGLNAKDGVKPGSVKVTEVGSTTKLEFNYNGKDYSFSVATEAAKSQLDSNTATILTKDQDKINEIVTGVSQTSGTTPTASTPSTGNSLTITSEEAKAKYQNTCKTQVQAFNPNNILTAYSRSALFEDWHTAFPPVFMVSLGADGYIDADNDDVLKCIATYIRRKSDLGHNLENDPFCKFFGLDATVINAIKSLPDNCIHDYAYGTEDWGFYVKDLTTEVRDLLYDKLSAVYNNAGGNNGRVSFENYYNYITVNGEQGEGENGGLFKDRSFCNLLDMFIHSESELERQTDNYNYYIKSMEKVVDFGFTARAMDVVGGFSKYNLKQMLSTGIVNLLYPDTHQTRSTEENAIFDAISSAIASYGGLDNFCNIFMNGDMGTISSDEMLAILTGVHEKSNGTCYVTQNSYSKETIQTVIQDENKINQYFELRGGRYYIKPGMLMAGEAENIQNSTIISNPSFVNKLGDFIYYEQVDEIKSNPSGPSQQLQVKYAKDMEWPYTEIKGTQIYQLEQLYLTDIGKEAIDNAVTINADGSATVKIGDYITPTRTVTIPAEDVKSFIHHMDTHSGYIGVMNGGKTDNLNIVLICMAMLKDAYDYTLQAEKYMIGQWDKYGVNTTLSNGKTIKVVGPYTVPAHSYPRSDNGFDPNALQYYGQIAGQDELARIIAVGLGDEMKNIIKNHPGICGQSFINEVMSELGTDITAIRNALKKSYKDAGNTVSDGGIVEEIQNAITRAWDLIANNPSQVRTLPTARDENGNWVKDGHGNTAIVSQTLSYMYFRKSQYDRNVPNNLLANNHIISWVLGTNGSWMATRYNSQGKSAGYGFDKAVNLIREYALAGIDFSASLCENNETNMKAYIVNADEEYVSIIYTDYYWDRKYNNGSSVIQKITYSDFANLFKGYSLDLILTGGTKAAEQKVQKYEAANGTPEDKDLTNLRSDLYPPIDEDDCVYAMNKLVKNMGLTKIDSYPKFCIGELEGEKGRTYKGDEFTTFSNGNAFRIYLDSNGDVYVYNPSTMKMEFLTSDSHKEGNSMPGVAAALKNHPLWRACQEGYSCTQEPGVYIQRKTGYYYRWDEQANQFVEITEINLETDDKACVQTCNAGGYVPTGEYGVYRNDYGQLFVWNKATQKMIPASSDNNVNIKNNSNNSTGIDRAYAAFMALKEGYAFTADDGVYRKNGQYYIFNGKGFAQVDERECAVAMVEMGLVNTKFDVVYCDYSTNDRKYYVWDISAHRMVMTHVDDITKLDEKDGYTQFKSSKYYGDIKAKAEGFYSTDVKGVYKRFGKFYKYDKATDSFVLCPEDGKIQIAYDEWSKKTSSVQLTSDISTVTSAMNKDRAGKTGSKYLNLYKQGYSTTNLPNIYAKANYNSKGYLDHSYTLYIYDFQSNDMILASAEDIAAAQAGYTRTYTRDDSGRNVYSQDGKNYVYNPDTYNWEEARYNTIAKSEDILSIQDENSRRLYAETLISLAESELAMQGRDTSNFESSLASAKQNFISGSIAVEEFENEVVKAKNNCIAGQTYSPTTPAAESRVTTFVDEEEEEEPQLSDKELRNNEAMYVLQNQNAGLKNRLENAGVEKVIINEYNNRTISIVNGYIDGTYQLPEGKTLYQTFEQLVDDMLEMHQQAKSGGYTATDVFGKYTKEGSTYQYENGVFVLKEAAPATTTATVTTTSTTATVTTTTPNSEAEQAPDVSEDVKTPALSAEEQYVNDKIDSSKKLLASYNSEYDLDNFVSLIQGIKDSYISGKITKEAFDKQLKMAFIGAKVDAIVSREEQLAKQKAERHEREIYAKELITGYETKLSSKYSSEGAAKFTDAVKNLVKAYEDGEIPSEDFNKKVESEFERIETILEEAKKAEAEVKKHASLEARKAYSEALIKSYKSSLEEYKNGVAEKFEEETASLVSNYNGNIIDKDEFNSQVYDIYREIVEDAEAGAIFEEEQTETPEPAATKQEEHAESKSVTFDSDNDDANLKMFGSEDAIEGVVGSEMMLFAGAPDVDASQNIQTTKADEEEQPETPEPAATKTKEPAESRSATSVDDNDDANLKMFGSDDVANVVGSEMMLFASAPGVDSSLNSRTTKAENIISATVNALITQGYPNEHAELFYSLSDVIQLKEDFINEVISLESFQMSILEIAARHGQEYDDSLTVTSDTHVVTMSRSDIKIPWIVQNSTKVSFDVNTRIYNASKMDEIVMDRMKTMRQEGCPEDVVQMYYHYMSEIGTGVTSGAESILAFVTKAVKVAAAFKKMVQYANENGLTETNEFRVYTKNGRTYIFDIETVKFYQEGASITTYTSAERKLAANSKEVIIESLPETSKTGTIDTSTPEGRTEEADYFIQSVADTIKKRGYSDLLYGEFLVCEDLVKLKADCVAKSITALEFHMGILNIVGELELMADLAAKYGLVETAQLGVYTKDGNTYYYNREEQRFEVQ